jgi:hypothetical protein
MSTKTKKAKVYDLVSKKPVAKFSYHHPDHSHPIRVTILVIEETDKMLTGYQVREGNIKRDPSEAVNESYVRSYRKDRIAKYGDYVRLRMSNKTFMKSGDESTLRRSSIITIFTEGV